MSLSKTIIPSSVLVQPRKTCPFIIARLLMGRKESNQTKKTKTIKKTENVFFFKTNYRLMQVKSITECSKGSSRNIPYSLLNMDMKEFNNYQIPGIYNFK